MNYFLTLLLFFSLEAHAWTKKICSTYSDTCGGGKLVEFCGTASLVEIDNQIFALTSSHLIEGKNLKIMNLDDSNLENIEDSRARIIDNDNDLALIAMNPTPEILATFSFQDGIFVLSPTVQSDIHGFKEKPLYYWRPIAEHAYLATPNWTHTPEDLGGPFFRHTSSLPLSLFSKFSLYPSEFNFETHLIVSYSNDIHKIGGNQEYISYLGIQPGTSGSPLVLESRGEYATAKTLYIGGLTKRYPFMFSRAYFSTEDQLANLARNSKNVLSGTKMLSSSFWEVCHGSTQKNYGNSRKELNTRALNSGGGRSGDGGGGRSGDGGDHKIFDRPNHAEMLWDNQETMAFEVKESPNKESYFLAADDRTINFTKHNGLTLIPVVSDSNLIPLIKNRNSFERNFPFQHNQTNVCYIDKTGLESNKVRISILGQPLAKTSSPDVLDSFELDSHGKYLGSKKFVPIIKTEKFYYDVTGLFFTTLEDIPSRIPGFEFEMANSKYKSEPNDYKTFLSKIFFDYTHKSYLVRRDLDKNISSYIECTPLDLPPQKM